MLVHSSVLESVGFTTHEAFAKLLHHSREGDHDAAARGVRCPQPESVRNGEQLDADGAKVILRRFIYEMKLPSERLHGVLTGHKNWRVAITK